MNNLSFRGKWPGEKGRDTHEYLRAQDIVES